MGSDIGTGAQLIFGTTAFAAEVVSITINGITRPSIDFTHLLTPVAAAGEMGGRVYKPGKYADPGEIGMEIHWPVGVLPPIMEPPEQITMRFPLQEGETNPAQYVFTGFLTSLGGTVPLEEKIAGNVTVKVSGLITHTAAT